MTLTELLDLEDSAHKLFAEAPDEVTLTRFIRQKQTHGWLNGTSITIGISLGQLMLSAWQTYRDRRQSGPRKPFLICPTCKSENFKVSELGKCRCENKHFWVLRPN
jgi:hypothetical protein